MKNPEIIGEKRLQELRAHLDARELEHTQEWLANCFAVTELARDNSITTCRSELLQQATAEGAEFIYFHPWVENCRRIVSGRVSIRATILLQLLQNGA